jgi:hypothetical protein
MSPLAYRDTKPKFGVGQRLIKKYCKDNMPPKKVFGQTLHKGNKQNNKRSGGGPSSYQRQFGHRGGKGNPKGGDNHGTTNADVAQAAAEAAAAARLRGEALDESFGIEKFSMNHSHRGETGNPRRRGWLYNVLATTVRTHREN